MAGLKFPSNPVTPEAILPLRNSEDLNHINIDSTPGSAIGCMTTVSFSPLYNSMPSSINWGNSKFYLPHKDRGLVSIKSGTMYNVFST